MGKLIDSKQYDADVDQRANDLDAELNEVRETEANALPDKYKGKSLEEVIQMHQEAEREKSRLGNEVGQLRQQVLQPRTTREEPKKKDVDVDALLENPEQAVETIVTQSETVKKLSEQVDNIDRTNQKREFEARHPEWQKDTQNQAFYDWVGKNRIRHTLALAADKGDYNAANELWDMWQEVKDLSAQATEQKKQETKAKREKQLQQGTLESGSGNTTESKKVFKRSEIRDLKTRAALGDRAAQATISDQNWQKEVMAAYSSGRVV
jgi:hypothetical protein